MKLVRQNEFGKYDNYDFGILLSDYTFYLYNEDGTNFTIKSTNDKTKGGMEKTLAKVFQKMLNYVTIKSASEIMLEISKIIDSREFGYHWQEFNIRLVNNSETNWKDELHGWW